MRSRSAENGHASGPVSRPGASRDGLRGAACSTSIVANNLPDLDFLYMGITPGKLGYLLHHRGYTHTLALVLPCAALTLAIMLLWRRYARAKWLVADWVLLAALAVLGPLCHIVMDYSNNYGIHPLWPFYNGWFYGDAIFIVEPWFWVVVIPSLFFAAQSRIAKASLAILFVGVLALAWTIRLMPWFSALLLSAAGSCSAWIVHKKRAHFRAIFGIVASLLVCVVFAASARLARAQATRLVAQELPHARLLDAVLSPVPATPFCFSGIIITLERADYVARLATIAPFPGLWPARDCPAAPGGGTAGVHRHLEERSAALVWLGKFSAPRSDLATLVRTRCDVAAFLRFARAPFWRKRGDQTLVVGDLRYDRNEGLDFSDLELSRQPECPDHVPAWSLPRADLLSR